jgi:murein DD-endopeptidase MepM/ murein hydrolase activator NlpD
MISKRVLGLFCLLILMSVPACQTATEIDNEKLYSISQAFTSLPQNPVVTTPTYDPIATTPIPTSQKTPDAMRFFLPTPGAQPVTAWRPPLYAVPWAASPYDHFYFTRPISVDQKNWPNPDYLYGGVFFKPGAVHTGIDIPASMGTTARAAGPGEVVWSGWGLYTGDVSNYNDPYGLAVVILHDFGYQNQPIYTVYAHLDEVDVIPGQWLQTGDILGKVGQTGYTTGPHLHFEVRLGNNTYFNTSNPELWLVQPQGWGVLAARVTDSYNNLLSDLDLTIVSSETAQEWLLKTYPRLGVLSDAFYQENLVMSDLPAGYYTISFDYLLVTQEIKVQIFPGQITYFTFRGLIGFGTTPPPTDNTNFPFTPTP